MVSINKNIEPPGLRSRYLCLTITMHDLYRALSTLGRRMIWYANAFTQDFYCEQMRRNANSVVRIQNVILFSLFICKRSTVLG